MQVNDRRLSGSVEPMQRQRRLELNARNIVEFRESGGKLSSFGDAPVLLLTTTGASSGKKRVNPMMYLADDSDPDRMYVFASAAGADANPAWLNNLVAAPEVEVEIQTEKLAARAEVVPEPARTEPGGCARTRAQAPVGSILRGCQHGAERRPPGRWVALRRYAILRGAIPTFPWPANDEIVDRLVLELAKAR